MFVIVFAIFVAGCDREENGTPKIGDLRIEYAQEVAKGSEVLTIVTKDNINLSAIDLGGDFTQGIILLHEVNGSKENLLMVGNFLKQNKFRVILLDFRSHGESEGVLSPNLDELTYDVEAAYNYLKNKTQVKEISVIGVGLGANVALGYETSFKNVAKIILISPEEEYGDFDIGSIRWVKKPILVISASGDQFFKEILNVREELSEESKSFGETEVVIDYKNETGRAVVENRKELQEKVVEFLRA